MRIWKRALAGLFVAIAMLNTGTRSFSAAPAAVWPAIDLVQAGAGLEMPVHLTHAGDGSGRLFVVEQTGRIRILQNGTVTGTFLDISGRVRSPASGGGSEEGLLSAAFPPGFGAGKQVFYVYYTNHDGNNQVSRFSLGNNPNKADPGSEKRILEIAHPDHANHNGGQIAFGPDGYLYIGTGDGGGGGDPQGNAQDPGTLLGKLLRIDVEMDTTPVTGDYLVYQPLVVNGKPGQVDSTNYTIPPDNPFAGRAGYRGEIWALGLRNPWRFSFDRQTGDLYTGDVGQAEWEEVDFQTASSKGGQNYGWNILEGFACFLVVDCDDTGMKPPVTVYRHISGNCSITGGYVYRGDVFPGLKGIYLFADFCSGRIWGLQREGSLWTQKELKDTAFRISGFGEGQDGSLYLLDHSGGKVYQIIVPTE